MTNNEKLKEILYIEQQKKLENYRKTRVLERPNVKKIHIILLCIAYLIIFTLGVYFLIRLNIDVIYRIIFIIIFKLLMLDFGLRFLGIMMVKCYQHYASDETRRLCSCKPSCSEYAIAVLKKYFIFTAIYKIIKRIKKTCDGTYKIDEP